MEKVDSATGEAQGDSTLDGAVYGLFKGETLLEYLHTHSERGANSPPRIPLRPGLQHP